MLRSLLTALLLVLGVLSPSVPALSQTLAAERAPVAWASLWVVAGQPTSFTLTARTRDTAIGTALEQIAGRPPKTSEHDEWTQWTIQLPVPSRRGFVLRQDLPIAPLLSVLRDMGEPNLSLMIQTPESGFMRLAGAPGHQVARNALSARLPTKPTGPVSFELGWRLADLVRSALLVPIALLLPIAAGLVIWRRSVARDRDPEKWFFRAQAIQVVTLAGWALWMLVMEATRIDDLIVFALGRHEFQSVAAFAWILVFLPSAFALAAMSRRIVRRLRGFDPMPRAGLFGSIRSIVLLVLLVLAASGFISGRYPLGVTALLTAIAASVLLPGARGPLGTSPQSLSSGALRDRLFELAHRAGVRLRELYVVPLRRERMANAFAVHGGVVMVADELLDNMSRREVDALLAHEIAHLEHHHPIKNLITALFVYASLLTTFLALRIPFGFVVGFLAAWLTHRFVARRHELAADAGAVALSGDAEALISGLGRLGSINQVPNTWGRGWAWLITHPTTEARALAIGRRAGIPPDRASELLARGLPREQGYGDRERPGEQERVFSTAWKTACTGKLGLASLAVSVLAPASVLTVWRALGLPLPHVVAILAGAVVSLLAILLLQDQLGARVVSRLETPLRRRLGAGAGSTEMDAERFVALSPGDRPRIYEGFLDWDLGLLTTGPEELLYRGEQVTLRLPRSAVSAIEVGAAAPSWLGAPRVIVRWLGPSGNESIALRPADCRRVSAIAPASRALASILDTWRARSDRIRDEGMDAPPGIGAVTARTPAQAAAPRDLVLVLTLIGAMSAAISFILRSDFWRGLDTAAAAFLGVMAMRWPMMTSRATRSPSQRQEPTQRAA